MIPYHYLHDIYSTFLQALCREYLTSHINFQASSVVLLKTTEAEKVTCAIREDLTQRKKKDKKKRNQLPKGVESVLATWVWWHPIVHKTKLPKQFHFPMCFRPEVSVKLNKGQCRLENKSKSISTLS